MRYLRTNTATRVTVGPFLSQSDGITPQTALTVTSEKLTLVVDTAGVPTLVLDAAPTASGGANDMVHVSGDDSGFYDLELAAADVNYLGRAMLSLNNVAAHCPVFHEFMILPAVVYDAMVLGTDLFDVSVTQILGAAPTEGAGGRLAAAFTKFFDKASPTGTINSIPDAVPGAVGALPTCDANNRVKVQGNIAKNAALTNFMVLMTDSTNHNPATGKTVTVTRSIDGGAFAALAVTTVTEVANGFYKFDLAAADLNGNTVVLRATATLCDDSFIVISTFV